MQSRSQPCIFLGYSTTQSAYRCYDPITKKLYLSRHVRFVEHVFPSKDCTNVPQFSTLFSAAPCTGTSAGFQEVSSFISPQPVGSILQESVDLSDTVVAAPVVPLNSGQRHTSVASPEDGSVITLQSILPVTDLLSSSAIQPVHFTAT